MGLISMPSPYSLQQLLRGPARNQFEACIVFLENTPKD